MTGRLSGERPAAADRRAALSALVRSMLVATAIVVGFFVLPLTRLEGHPSLALVGGLLAVVVLLVWEILEIRHSAYPRIRGVEAMALVLAVFFACFATTYYLMSDAHPSGFNEPLTRLDAAYFVVTVFSTVGFGDIVAASQTARAVVTLQMLADLALIAFVARILLNIVQSAAQAKQEKHDVERGI